MQFNPMQIDGYNDKNKIQDHNRKGKEKRKIFQK